MRSEHTNISRFIVLLFLAITAFSESQKSKPATGEKAAHTSETTMVSGAPLNPFIKEPARTGWDQRERNFNNIPKHV